MTHVMPYISVNTRKIAAINEWLNSLLTRENIYGMKKLFLQR